MVQEEAGHHPGRPARAHRRCLGAGWRLGHDYDGPHGRRTREQCGRQAPAAVAEQPADEPAAEAPAAPANVFAGQLEDDQVVQGGGTATIEEWEITVTPLEFRDEPFGTGGQNVCSDVTLVNASDGNQDFNGLSFQLQDPAGGIQDFGTIGESDQTLSSGSVAPGGQVTGEQCFEGRDSGQYVLLYQPNIFTAEGRRVAFVQTL